MVYKLQGAVFGPTFLLYHYLCLYINSLLDLNVMAKMICFADDIVLC